MVYPLGQEIPYLHLLKPSIIRLGVLLLLFDVYLTWARIEKQAPSPNSPESNNFGRLAKQPIVYQYIFFRKALRVSSAYKLAYCGSCPLHRLDHSFPYLYSLPDIFPSLPFTFAWVASYLRPSEFR